MAIYTAEALRNWDMSRSPDWKPARPINHQCDGWLKRIRLAYGVLIGRYDALNWEDHEPLPADKKTAQ